MNIKQLKYFCSVVEFGSISAAANELYIAAPAVSMQISSFEEELGGDLFDRSSRPMTLTKLGEFIYQRAPEIIYKIDNLERDATFYVNSKSTSLDVCFVRSLMFNILPETIKYHLDSSNHIDISLTEVLSEHQIELLSSQKLDLGFSRLMSSKIDDGNGLIYDLILVDPLVAAIPKNHHLAKKKYITLRDFCSSPFIIFPSDPKSVYSKVIFSKFDEYGIKPVVSYRVVEINTALALVGAGLGVTLVGGSTVKNNRQDIVFLPIEDFKCLSFIYAIYHPKNRNPNITEFIHSMKTISFS